MGGGGPREPWQGIDPAKLNLVFADLEKRCLDAIERAGVPRREAELSRTVDMRYRRQTHDRMIPVGAGEIAAEDVKEVVSRFERTYELVYGKGAGFREAGIALSTFRVSAVGRTRKPLLRGPEIETAPIPGEREIFEPALKRRIGVTVWNWLTLPKHHRIQGPAIVEHPETTAYVAVGQTALIDGMGNLTIELAGACA